MNDDRCRGVSHHVYGNSYLIEVAAAIAAHPKERFTPKILVDATLVEKNLVAMVLRRLAAAGLVTRLPKDGRDQPYLRVPSVFWEGVERHRREIVD